MDFSPGNTAGLELLIVDDELRVTKALEREIRLLFPPESFAISTFANPVTSLDYMEVHGENVFMVISDLRMPEMNGAELLERIHAVNTDVQTTLLTAYSDINDISRAVSAHIRNLLVKPWDQKKLFDAVSGALYDYQLLKENRALKDKLSQQLSTAGSFQRAILTGQNDLPFYPDITFEYQPLAQLGCGGDYLDIFSMPDGKIIMLVADVSGHGIKPALITMMVKTLVQNYRLSDTRLFSSPADFLGTLNRELCQQLAVAPDALVACTAAFFQPDAQLLHLANAGLPAVILSSETGQISTYASDGQALGFSMNSDYNDHTIMIGRGTNLVIHTDGLTEFITNGPVVSASQTTLLLAGLVAENATAPTVTHAFQQLQPDKRFSDDVCVVIARF